eukprot:Awhi_evm1s11313
MKSIFAVSALAAIASAQSPCTLANIDSPGVTTFQSGSRVQVTVNRVCTCEDGEFIECAAPIEGEEGVLIRAGVAAAIEENEVVERPVDISRSFNQILGDFESEDFVFDFRMVPVESMGIGGLVQPVGLGAFPVLALGDVAVTRFTLDPCGLNLPHVHPRGTEIIFMFKGSKLRTSFAGENGGPVVTLDITNDTSTFFPQGLIHGQQNMGCDTVAFISSLNSADPGLQTITSSFFSLPIEGVAGSLDISAEEAEELRDGLPLNIVLTSKDQGQCMKKCGL